MVAVLEGMCLWLQCLKKLGKMLRPFLVKKKTASKQRCSETVTVTVRVCSSLQEIRTSFLKIQLNLVS